MAWLITKNCDSEWQSTDIIIQISFYVQYITLWNQTTSPVVVLFSIYVEVLVMWEGFVSLLVFELDMQAVFFGVGQLVNDIVPEPVFPRGLTKTLHLTKINYIK